MVMQGQQVKFVMRREFGGAGICALVTVNKRNSAHKT
jgi:hypothetical protein